MLSGENGMIISNKDRTNAVVEEGTLEHISEIIDILIWDSKEKTLVTKN